MSFRLRIFLLFFSVWTGAGVVALALSPPVTLTDTYVGLAISAAEPYTYKIWKATSPSRLVVDIADTPQARAGTSIPPELTFNDALVEGVRRAPSPDGSTRVVLDLAYAVPFWDDLGWVQGADGVYTLTIVLKRQFVQQQTYPVGNSVRLILQHRGETYGPVTVDILAVQVHDPSVKVQLALAKDGMDGLETVLSIAKRTGALAAVNGTYFHGSGLPLGLMASYGIPYSPSIYDRSAFLVMKDSSYGISRASTRMKLVLGENTDITVNGLNRQRRTGEVVVYNEAYGVCTPKAAGQRELVLRNGIITSIALGGTPLTTGTVVVATDPSHSLQKLKVGDALRFVWSIYLLDHKVEVPGDQVWLALGAGPRLVQAGKVKVTALEELFRSDITKGRAPRTALGITSEGHMLFVVVNGRQEDVSEGMTLQELADLMKELGAVEAINLDGGGSSTMVVRDRVINMPSAGERCVGSAILIFAPTP